MIVMGLNQGMQPIAGYNFGAKQYPRVTQVLKITIYAATIVTTIGFLMGMFIPQLAVSIFTTHEELVNISAKGLRIVVMFFPIVGFQMVTSNFFRVSAWRARLSFSLYFPSGACTDSLPVDSSPVLRAARRVDQYAYL